MKWCLRKVPALCAFAVVTAALAAGGSAGDPSLPRPGPQGRSSDYDAVTANAGCVECHSDIGAEWNASLHRAAWDDPVFLSAYSLENRAFCKNCHAPEGMAKTDDAELRHLGVACVTCHVQDGEIVGTRARSGGAHAVRRDARLATTAACASCHDFEFPEKQHAPMQGTVREHLASPQAKQSCQSCHMSKVGSGDARHSSHGMFVAGNAAMLRSAVKTEVARREDRLLFTLAARDAGHAVPTGDMFRRLEVRARIEGRSATFARALSRRFKLVHGANGPERIEIADERLPASGEAVVVELPFGAPLGDAQVFWQVVYQRMEPAMAITFGLDPAADEIVLAEGSF